MYIPNDDTQKYPFVRLQLVVETFEHSTSWTNQSKFNKSCCENVNIKLWGLDVKEKTQLW